MTRQLCSVLAAGLIFGAGLAVSGMADPARVIGFLHVTGALDASLVFVMAGAVGTFGAGMLIGRKLKRGKGGFGTTLPTCDRSPVDASLAIGSAIFGIGWGLGGFCPGPAIANLGAWHVEALVFVPAMAIGMVAVRAFAGVDRD